MLGGWNAPQRAKISAIVKGFVRLNGRRPHKMYTRNTASRVIPLRDTLRRSAKPRAKKATPSFPTVDQLEQVRIVTKRIAFV